MNQLVQQGLLSGSRLRQSAKREPGQYKDRQTEYYAEVTDRFRQENLKYASDFFEALVQNWDKGGEWESFYIRMADVVRPTAAITRKFDDYKMIIPQEPEYTYLRPGTLIQAMGSYWMVYNPLNISGGEGASIIRRCNTTWNHYDYYGNLVKEPIIVENARANASTPDAEDSIPISRGYYNVVCQYNEFTRQVNDNTRLILGSKAYQVTGYGDFFHEFTGDYDTVRTLEFSIRVLTKNEDTDDMDNHVAEGMTRKWSAKISGNAAIGTNKTSQLSVIPMIDKKPVESTDDHPISFIWASSDTSVVSVTQDGSIWAKRSGVAFVTATMVQNSNVSARIAVTVMGTGGTKVLITKAPTTALSPFQTCEVEARYYLNGSERGDAVEWELLGADEGSYAYTVDGNTLTVTCFGYSKTPLIIRAKYNNLAAQANLRLEGF